MNITGMDLWDVLRLIKSGETTSSEVVGQCLEKARETAYYNAFTFVNKDKALEGAAAVDEKIKADRHTGILAGIPVAVKDNICLRAAARICSRAGFST